MFRYLLLKSTKKNFWMDLKVLFNFNTNQSDAHVAEGLSEILSLCSCGWGYFYWVQSNLVHDMYASA